MVEEGADIKQELYVSLVVDRVTQKIVLMGSSEGGMDIEEVAEKHPELIHKVIVEPSTGLLDAQADDLAAKIGVPAASIPQARAILQGLYKAFWETDASLAEINPLNVSSDGKVIALDAKFNFDSNALFRHRKSSRTAIWTKKIRLKSKRRSSTSRTSRSTATSAVS